MKKSYLLPTTAQTGNAAKGNPYRGGIGTGIAYDRYEACYPQIVSTGDFPAVIGAYRSGARRLVGFMPLTGRSILDVGSGTGISTLELLERNRGARVTGIEISESMLTVARYKFHQAPLGVLRNAPPEVRAYWDSFRKEAAPFSGQASFVHGDVQKPEALPEPVFDAAVANQVMHWTDLTISFSRVCALLRPGASLFWNSASHFYNDRHFPSLKYGFRYNDFMCCVLDIVSKKADVRDLKTLSRPQHNLKTITDITGACGLLTKQVGTWLLPVDLQIFIKNHVPAFVKALLVKEMAQDELKSVTAGAIAKAVNTPSAMSDSKHKYDIVPYFRSTKV